jgi:hypothetical protein
MGAVNGIHTKLQDRLKSVLREKQSAHIMRAVTHYSGPYSGDTTLREGESSNVVPLIRRPEPQVSFDRRELTTILDLYGRFVAAGEWRDYALDFGREKACFLVFRRSGELPLYRIEKCPKLAAKQGAYSVVAAAGLILKRGGELSQVLRVFDKPLRLVT